MITSYNELPPFKDLFEPDFENGKLYWKKISKYHNEKLGIEAGPKLSGGLRGKYYQNVKIAGEIYSQAKILYFLKYGVWCPTIDHINGDSLDNTIKNLREVSLSKNAWNRERAKPSKKLPYGVSQQGGKYRVRVKQFQEQVYLGSYDTIQEAKQAYDDFYRNYYGENLAVDYYLEYQQSSPEWHFLRQHRVTGTTAYKLLEGMPIQDIIDETEQEQNFQGNQYTERGKTLETENRRLYEDINQTKVHEVGGIINSKYPQFFYSPDGCVGLDGLIECKSFLEEHHENTIKNLDSHIIAQIQFGLFISEREWCDLCLYNPDAQDLDKAYWVHRIYPDPEIFTKFKQALNQPVKQEITSDEKQLISLQQSLQAFEAELGERLTAYQQQKQELESLKQKIKQETSGRVSKTVEWEGNKLTLSIYDTHSVSVNDPSLVEDQYKTEIELPNAYERDGKIYTQEINTQLVKNYLKAGKSLPSGFKDKTTRNIRLKFNGKAI